MNRGDMAARLAERTGVKKEVCELIINEGIDILRESLIRDETAYFRGLGTIKIEHKCASIGNRIVYENGEKKYVHVNIPEHYAPKMKFSRLLKTEIAEHLKDMKYDRHRFHQ